MSDGMGTAEMTAPAGTGRRESLTGFGRHCRFCDAPVSRSFADLGMSPLANTLLLPHQLANMEPFFPLHAFVCDRCFLVQVNEYEKPEAIFGDYAYFSSYSSSWLEHARRFSQSAIARFGLDSGHLVVELASNDGYLLQYFNQAGIPTLGIEPAENVAAVAQQRGISTISRFFGRALADELVAEGRQADLLIGINVFAHVPDLHDFVAGISWLLKPDGVLCLEFPHLLRLIEGRQFDTIYHEHFSYFSLHTAAQILAAHGLAVVDVEEVPTHGGSIRVYACHVHSAARRMTAAPSQILDAERRHGLNRPDTYDAFSSTVRAVKRNLLRFLIDAREAGKQVVGYGAPAKAATLLNYCGVRDDLLFYTVDVSPHKQNRFLPGVHIPIYAPEHIESTKPDYVLILPWNLRSEIMEKMSHIRRWGGQFVIPLPDIEILR